MVTKITTNGITDSDITTDKIADGAVTTAKIINDAVTNAKILDGAIDYDKLASALIASQVQAEAGTSDVTLMTPLKTAQAITAQTLASDASPLQTGANDTVYTFTHTLGRQPVVVELWGVMTTAIYGFAIGDEVKISSAEGQAGTYYGAAIWIESGNTTEVKVNCNNSFAFFDAVSGGTARIVQITDMDLYVKVIG